MRIHMYPAGHGGVALYTYKLADGLADQGLRVTLFGDDQYELDHLPTKFVKANVLSSGYACIRRNKGTVARIVRIIGAHVYNSFKFYSYVKQDKPDIVHLHSFFFYPVEWILLNRLKRMNCKVVLTVHNIVPYRYFIQPFPSLDLAILQYVYKLADKLIVHTEANRQQLLGRFSVDGKKVAVIPHGEYSLEKMCHKPTNRQARKKLNIPDDQQVILFFGYIRKIKGIDILLKAFDFVAERYPDIILIIAGSVIEGQSFYEYSQIINEMKYGGRVRCFIKYIEHEDIPIFFTAADIVVIPYTEFSGQSGVLHVAQGFGKAVIASSVGGLPEAVLNKRTALIVPPGDIESLAEAISYLLKNEEERIKMGKRARKMAIDRFSWQTIARDTLEKVYS